MKAFTMRAIPTLIVSAALTLSACSHYPSPIDESFGNSVRQMVKLQTADPAAPRDGGAALQSDGQSAKSAVDRYQKSFEVLPLPVNVFNIGVGGGAAR